MKIQEAFDRMVTHLAQQKMRAYDPELRTCVYRGPHGIRCVVGALLSDQAVERLNAIEPDPSKQAAISFRQSDKWEAVKEDLALEGMEVNEAVDFYAQMQNVHDNCHMLPALKALLQQTANDYKLNGDLIEKITEWKY